MFPDTGIPGRPRSLLTFRELRIRRSKRRNRAAPGRVYTLRSNTPLPSMPIPEIGSPAPDFSGVTQDGTKLSLADFRGQRLALYFYPRDHTPGCTKQACNLRDHFGALKEAGIAIVGVSDDPVDRHGSFAEKHGLPFPLIADTGRTILEAYGTRGEKKLYGRIFLGTQRMTFLIGADGTVVDVIRKPKVGDHAAEIMSRFEKAG